MWISLLDNESHIVELSCLRMYFDLQDIEKHICLLNCQRSLLRYRDTLEDSDECCFKRKSQ